MTLLKVNGTPVRKQFGSLFNEWLNDFSEQATEQRWSASVPVNIHETKEAYHLEFSVPGLKKDDLKIAVENGVLTVSYEAKEEAKSEDYKTIRREFRHQSFKRSFTLSDKVNADGIEGKYEDGVLKVLVPRKPEAQPVAKQISIQ